MATAAEIEVLIDTAAAGVQEMQVDGRRAKSHSLKDLIEYLKWKSAQEAAANGSLGIRFINTSPPGAQ